MSLDEVVHPKFSYVFIPVDINDPVEERTFEGKEHNFRELLNSHFNRENLLKAEEDSFKKDLSQKADGKLTDAQLSCLVSGQHTYQVGTHAFFPDKSTERKKQNFFQVVETWLVENEEEKEEEEAKHLKR